MSVHSLTSRLATAHHLHLTIAGVQKLCEDLGTSHPATAADEAALMDAALNRSLYDIGAASVLPRSASSSSSPDVRVLPITAWLQLVSVRNIAAPIEQNNPADMDMDRASGRGAVASSSSPRLLQLELTDGVSTVLAIEHEPLIALDVSSLQPGRKMLVRSGCPIREGILLLGPAHVTLPVRGQVDLLNQESAAMREANASRVESAIQTSDAPIFRPYAQRAQAQRESQLEQQLADAQRKERQRREDKIAPPAAPVVVAPSPAVSAASAIANRAHAQLQLELENEYESAASARGAPAAGIASAAAPASVASASAGPTAASVRRPPGKTSGSVAAPVLSSFRTLLSAPLSECVSFSALAVDVQLFPPRAGQKDFVLQLTMQDSFQLRAVVTASARVFERFFWPQSTFASMMSAPEGQARVKARLVECKAKLCLPHHFWDIDLQIVQAAGAPRSFHLLSIGEWVRSQRVAASVPRVPPGAVAPSAAGV